ncbi:MAG: hypothetical protein ACTIBW_10505 [Brachybacterium alimentarium]
MATSGEAEDSRAWSVLIVCTANICRSPVAAGLLEVHMAGTGISVSSAGTRALIDHPPVPEAVDYVRRRTGTTPRTRGTPLTAQLVRGRGLILTMTEQQRAEVVRIAPGALRRVFTLRQFVRLAPHLPPGASYATVCMLAEGVARCRTLAGPARDGEDDIVDPYGGPPTLYEESFALIARASSGIAAVLRARLAVGDTERASPVGDPEPMPPAW